MDYALPKGLTPEDVFFWILGLAQERFRSAEIFISDDYSGWQPVSLNLDKSMYECFCPFDEMFNICMECGNGDRITYEAVRPEMLQVEGLDVFENAAMRLPPPERQETLFHGDPLMRKRFRIGGGFARLETGDKLRHCMNAAVRNGAQLLVSAKENHWRATPVLSRSVLSGYEILLDAAVRFGDDKWALIHMPKGMVYTYGLDFSAAQALLGNIINE